MRNVVVIFYWNVVVYSILLNLINLYETQSVAKRAMTSDDLSNALKEVSAVNSYTILKR
jgi:hypothetical protein